MEESKVACGFSTAWEVNTPNPCVGQGSTVLEKHELHIVWYVYELYLNKAARAHTRAHTHTTFTEKGEKNPLEGFE